MSNDIQRQLHDFYQTYKTVGEGRVLKYGNLMVRGGARYALREYKNKRYFEFSDLYIPELDRLDYLILKNDFRGLTKAEWIECQLLIQWAVVYRRSQLRKGE